MQAPSNPAGKVTQRCSQEEEEAEQIRLKPVTPLGANDVHCCIYYRVIAGRTPHPASVSAYLQQHRASGSKWNPEKPLTHVPLALRRPWRDPSYRISHMAVMPLNP